MGCTLTNGNFLPWSLTSFKDKLMAGIQTLVGARVLYSTSGSSEDGSWFYSVGGDGLLPAGFDGVVNGGIPTMHQNVAVNLSPFGDYLYAGLVATFSPEGGATEEYLTGSHIWKTSDGINWQQVTVDGFGDDYVIGFEAFTTFAEELYVSASKGASASTESLGGASIFRLISDPSDDYDEDGLINSTDNCPLIASADQTDSDRDDAGDVCDTCPNTFNPDQKDADHDGLGDACDTFPTSYPPLPEALDALESDSVVTVREVVIEEWEDKNSNYYYLFEPNNVDPTVGYIFYPGGLVDPRSYAPPFRAIAAEGYLTIIVKMPADLAPGGSTRANTIIDDDQYAGIKKWILGGHSVGGTFAYSFAKKFPDQLDGTAIWASYPTEAFRIDDKDLEVLVIYGTNNPGVNDDEIELNKPYLPADTTYVRIEGGNHTQFGWYDTYPLLIQGGDDYADITREEQQKIIINETVDFLSTFTTGN